VTRPIFACAGGELALPEATLVLVDRQDGGNLIVTPPRDVWERSELTGAELTAWSLLVAASGRAMLEALPQLDGGGINFGRGYSPFDTRHTKLTKRTSKGCATRLVLVTLSVEARISDRSRRRRLPMRLRAVTLVLLLLSSVLPAAQTPAPAQTPAADATAPATLPIKRVVLYKTGVGYFEHLGNVRNRQDVTVRFTSAQLNDVLKSLTAIDLGKGQITAISYNSTAPLDQRLGALRLPLDRGTSAADLLRALRGARVELTSAGATVEGRLLSVDQRTQGKSGETTTVDVVSVVTDTGELRAVDLTPAVRVRVVERDLRQEIGRYLDLVGSTREQDVRSLLISTTGSGDRQLFVSYISEVPVWKSTYRLVLPSKGAPLLQGWAIVDNTIGEDWRNIDLSLVAGAPQSFIQQISQPYYTRRPVVPMPANVQLAPQTHQATLQSGLEETVTVSANAPPAPPPPAAAPAPMFRSGLAAGAAGGRGGGARGGVADRVDAFEQLRDAEAAASAETLGDLFEYHIKEPVTLRKNQSALVPIINAEVAAEKVSLWNRSTGSGHPLRAVWLTNATNLTLDGGSITLIAGEAFAGEGLIEPLKPGEKRLVSYAADLGTQVDARADATTPRRIVRVRARDGILIQEAEERSAWVYRVRNEDTSPTTLVVEHRTRPGWKLAEGQTPAETTADASRFRVTVDAKKETTLTVREVRAGETRVAITEVNDALIAQLAQSGVSSGALQQALKPVFDKKSELAGFERQLQSLQGRQTAVVQDQERVRENMKALKGSAEEKQLLQRYTRQLDEQENQLDALKKDIEKATAERDRARQELSALIATVSFDLPGQGGASPAPTGV
jgi:hypothetical protein